MQHPESETSPAPLASRGFVLALTIIMVLGVSAISVSIMYTGKMGRMSSINYKNKIQTFLAADGMTTLLAQELINGNADKYVDSTRLGRIRGQVWQGINGDDVFEFIELTKRDPTPDREITSSYLGSNLNEEFYGVKWTGWIIPPISGAYTFYTRSDNGSAFFLSSDAEQANLSSEPICKLSGYVYSWPTSGDPVSHPIPLIAGNRYYFEYYHKEGWGFDVGQVGWDGPEYFAERPISGIYLSEYKSDPKWAGTVNVGDLPVRYQVVETGMDRYRIYTESINVREGVAKDTSFRTPLVQSLSLKGQAVKPPNKMWMRVIHYDYSSTDWKSEFNMPTYDNGLKTGMVEPVLTTFTSTDASFFGRATISKPTRTNNSIANRNCGLNKWFRDWTTDRMPFRYHVPWDATSTDDAKGCTDREYHSPGDRWRNRKYRDSLEFTLQPSQGPNTYVFSQMGNYDTGDPHTSWRGDATMYFPLDKYGEDPPGSGHNFGFCTELHTTFIHQSGLRFEFTGDDDVWVFIDDKLVIDLGGMHIAHSAMLYLDDLKHLKFGATYNFDLFQCERHQHASSSRMVTNIKMIPPQGNPVAHWRRDYSSMD